MHTEQGVDGLAPRGTIAPLGGDVTRAAMLFNWTPDRLLYVTDPMKDAILVLSIVDNGHVFMVGGKRWITNEALHEPVDLAPAVPEIVNGTVASNTTLAGAPISTC